MRLAMDEIERLTGHKRARAPLVRSFMVAGTGMGAGKTLVATTIVRSLRRRGIDAVAMKTVARGDGPRNGGRSSDELRRLAAASAFDLPPSALCGHWLPADDGRARGRRRRAPASREAIVDTFQVLSTWADAVVVEEDQDSHGAAARRIDADDLARELKLPVLLVVGMQAGCVPLALARAQALARGGLECAGWIANQLRPDRRDDEALQVLREGMAAPCLGSLPWLHAGNAATAAMAIDIEGLLLSLAHEPA
jgi:dethiobiotin synthetase